MYALHSLLVGYQNRETTPSQWNLICSTFKSVGKAADAITLGDLKPNELWSYWDGDTVQLLDDGGGTRQREDDLPALYTYITEVDGAPADGWYQFDKAYNEGEYISADSESLIYGEGFVITVANEGAGMMFSGEVPKGPQSFLINKEGWNLIGNALPIATTLANVTPNESYGYWDGDTIQFLDEGGGTRQREDGLPALYTYITVGDGAPADGWYQFDKAYNEGEFIAPEDEDFQLAAGKAFVVTVSNPETCIQFPAAIAE